MVSLWRGDCPFSEAETDLISVPLNLPYQAPVPTSWLSAFSSWLPSCMAHLRACLWLPGFTSLRTHLTRKPSVAALSIWKTMNTADCYFSSPFLKLKWAAASQPMMAFYASPPFYYRPLVHILQQSIISWAYYLIHDEWYETPFSPFLLWYLMGMMYTGQK